MEKLTIRDKLAMNVMPTIIKVMVKYGKESAVISETIQLANKAYEYADAMLEARKIK